jgi:lipid A 3-O-deacylase
LILWENAMQRQLHNFHERCLMNSLSTLAVLGSLLLSQPALHAQTAQSSAERSQRWSAHLGYGFDLERIGIHWESPEVWTSSLMGKSVELSNEFGVAQWAYIGPKNNGQTRALLQLSAIPIFRWWVDTNVFLEGGIGATLISKNELGPRNLSSIFQFGDHIGFGYRLTPSSLVGWRYSHFSNADIKMPNRGLDIFQLTLRSTF